MSGLSSVCLDLGQTFAPFAVHHIEAIEPNLDCAWAPSLAMACAWLAGIPNHRDWILVPQKRAAGHTMMIGCGVALG